MAKSKILKKIPTIRSQVLRPIKRPLTASNQPKHRKTLKMGIKLKYGETPTSRSLSKTHKSGTHAKPSSCRAVLLLVPKTADGRIARIFREKFLSLKKSLKKMVAAEKIWFIHVFGSFIIGEDNPICYFVLL